MIRIATRILIRLLALPIACFLILVGGQWSVVGSRKSKGPKSKVGRLALSFGRFVFLSFGENRGFGFPASKARQSVVRSQ